jgi:hypothetical protein
MNQLSIFAGAKSGSDCVAPFLMLGKKEQRRIRSERYGFYTWKR